MCKLNCTLSSRRRKFGSKSLYHFGKNLILRRITRINVFFVVKRVMVMFILRYMYVDDGLIAAKSIRSITKITNALKKMFDITLGNAEMFLGLQMDRDRYNKQMFLSQRNYIQQILNKFGMNDAKEIAVPAYPHMCN